MTKNPRLNSIRRQGGYEDVNCVSPESKEIIQNNKDNTKTEGKHLETFMITYKYME